MLFVCGKIKKKKLNDIKNLQHIGNSSEAYRETTGLIVSDSFFTRIGLAIEKCSLFLSMMNSSP